MNDTQDSILLTSVFFRKKKTEVSDHLLSYNENIAVNCRIVSEGPVTEMPRTCG
jgi:hypothetical protein